MRCLRGQRKRILYDVGRAALPAGSAGTERYLPRFLVRPEYMGGAGTNAISNRWLTGTNSRTHPGEGPAARHAIHVLKCLEKAVHPRWPMTFEVAKRAVGVTVLLLTVVLLLTPVPLSNVAPAMVISLISLAYIEEDGLLLSVGFLAAIILIGLGSAAVWGAIVGAVLISA